MGYLEPINIYNSIKTPFRGKNTNSKPENENENNRPKWKRRLVIGGLLTVALVAIITNTNPSRKIRQREFDKFYDSFDENLSKGLPMLSNREEVIISEAAKGNKTAQKLMDTLPRDAYDIEKYIKAKQKYESALKYFNEGRFDYFKRKHDKNIKETQNWFNNQLQKLKQTCDELYKKYLEGRSV